MLSFQDTEAKLAELDSIEKGWEEERKQMEETIKQYNKAKEDFFLKKPDLLAQIKALQKELEELQKNSPPPQETPKSEEKPAENQANTQQNTQQNTNPPQEIQPPKSEPVVAPQPQPVPETPKIPEKVEDKVLKDIQIEAPKTAKKGKKPLKKKSSKSKESSAATESDPSKFEYGLKYTLAHHVDTIRSIVFHPTLPLLASASDDGTIRFTNVLFKIPKRVASPKQYMSIRVKDVPILAMATKGNSLYTGAVDGLVQQFDFGRGNEDIFAVHGKADHHLLNFFEAGDAIWSIAAHEKSSYIVAVCADKSIRLLDSTTLEQKNSIPTDSPPTSAAFDENGESYAVGCQDGTILIMKGPDLQEKKKFDSFIYSITRYNDTFAVGFENGKIVFLDGADEIQAHNEAVTSMCTLGPALISGSNDCFVKAFIDGEQKLAERVSEKKFAEGVLAVASSDTMFVAATSDGYLKVFVKAK